MQNEDIMKYLPEFKEQMTKGLEFGTKKYGLDGFLGDSQLDMLEEELRDIANYAYLLYAKVKMIKEMSMFF